ncbi:MAG: hypothetical protein ACNA7Z_03160 [Dethiobacteria bacterium]|nr:hypothetical protein [Bacillota bacterium]MDW7730362.1 hypothetical protein [Bacillota bacterium]
MSDLVRKQLYITQKQESLLKKKAAELGKTEAEIVREALDSNVYMIDYPKKSAEKWQEEAIFIETRRSGKAAVQKDRSWKREDLYDR